MAGVPWSELSSISEMSPHGLNPFDPVLVDDRATRKVQVSKRREMRTDDDSGVVERQPLRAFVKFRSQTQNISSTSDHRGRIAIDLAPVLWEAGPTMVSVSFEVEGRQVDGFKIDPKRVKTALRNRPDVMPLGTLDEDGKIRPRPLPPKGKAGREASQGETAEGRSAFESSKTR